MAAMAKHESTGPAPRRSRADVWFVLIVTGTTSAILQMWHATHAGGAVLLIAALVGLVPAATAVGLSHVVASHKSVVILRTVTFAVMLAVMAASASAVAAVVRPIDGPVFSWVFGLALDAAALACVWVLLGDSERKAEEATALQRAETEVAEARSAKAGALANVADLDAELARMSAELAAANATAEALRSAAQNRHSKGAGSGKPRARMSADPPDLTTELRALQMLDAHPELRAKGQGAELGRRLGVSPAHGRRLHARLTTEERPADALQERSEERPGERSA